MEIRHKKALGQNFLSDPVLLGEIADAAGVTAADTVLEIGAGAGALTEQLARRAARVVAYEIDADLAPVLTARLAPFENVELVFEDYLARTSERVVVPFRVVANLPYYVTTPILFDLIERASPPESITVMVQKEVADRLTAAPSTAAYGALTASVALYGDARLVRIVPARLFTPVPKVDSALVRIDRTHTFDSVDKKAVSRAIRAGFAMRRKTLLNNISAAYALDKDAARAVLAACGIDPTARGETLSAADFVRLADALSARK